MRIICRALGKREKNYSMSEPELLDVVEAATRFCVYLAMKIVYIIVDHKALTFVDHRKSPTSPRLQRWAMFMRSQLSYTVQEGSFAFPC